MLIFCLFGLMKKELILFEIVLSIIQIDYYFSFLMIQMMLNKTETVSSRRYT